MLEPLTLIWLTLVALGCSGVSVGCCWVAVGGCWVAVVLLSVIHMAFVVPFVFCSFCLRGFVFVHVLAFLVVSVAFLVVLWSYSPVKGGT